MSESNRFQMPPDQSNLLPKVIYVPQEWSDSVELEEISTGSITAEVIESIEPSSFLNLSEEQDSSIQATILNSSKTEFSQERSWLTVVRKLRQQNRELLKTVVNLEQALGESQHQLHNQTLRSRSAESLLTKQTQELTQTQAQITHLTRELEQAQHLTKNQKFSLLNLTQQFESTQQQAALLERECALLKEDNNEKTQKLIFLEQEIAELSSRLHRQQRYTLQYKAALDQCLEVPQAQLNHSSTAYSLTSKVTSIQPWSSHRQQLSSQYLAESTLEINPYDRDIEGKFLDPINLSLDQTSQSFVDEPNIPSKIDLIPSNFNSSLNSDYCEEPLPDEDEIEAFLDEFFTAFEPEKTVSSEPMTKGISANLSNWPSPVISSVTSVQKKPSRNIELPGFLRSSSQITNE
ncbi:hypothetical protein [Gloeothece verrucosa]|uniref:Uncharacterized protein n=1 Tax=Gloeothece verrucosa (strain PCC 7822) TaxID=497965 RepID=E0U9L1_GLOV7|nr:hypothetical protein [Gloeothece verrucosa]ADN13812.1 hypothetical protein Cyan7822_1826 [Gloeothece verrucosa PCC 7822]